MEEGRREKQEALLPLGRNRRGRYRCRGCGPRLDGVSSKTPPPSSHSPQTQVNMAGDQQGKAGKEVMAVVSGR